MPPTWFCAVLLWIMSYARVAIAAKAVACGSQQYLHLSILYYTGSNWTDTDSGAEPALSCKVRDRCAGELRQVASRRQALQSALILARALSGSHRAMHFEKPQLGLSSDFVSRLT